MRGALLSLLAVGAIYTGGVAPAAARDYPYCLQAPETGIPGDCSYTSYAQCRASASGRLADCNLNPRVAYGRQLGARGYRGDQGYRRSYDERW